MILIDPGHGNSSRRRGVYDPGAVGVGGAEEAVYNHNYALTLKWQLEKLRISSILTRPTSTTHSHLRDRLWMARRVLRPDLLVSIHFNADARPGVSAPDGRVKGFEVIWRTAGSRMIAHLVGDALRKGATRKRFRRWFDPANHLYILKYDPSILVEFGFLDDPEDFKLIDDERWQQGVTRSVAEAINSWLRAGAA